MSLPRTTPNPSSFEEGRDNDSKYVLPNLWIIYKKYNLVRKRGVMGVFGFCFAFWYHLDINSN